MANSLSSRRQKIGRQNECPENPQQFFLLHKRELCLYNTQLAWVVAPFCSRLFSIRESRASQLTTSTGAVTCYAVPAEVLAPPGTRTNVGIVGFRLCRRIVSSAHFIRPDDAHPARLLGLWNGICRVTCAIWNGRKWVVSATQSVNTDNMNELALRLIFYTQIPVREKTPIERMVCVVVSVLFRDTNTNELRRNPIRQDVRTPMQRISAWPTEIMSGVLGMKQSGYTGSARVANDARNVYAWSRQSLQESDTWSL